MLKIVFLESKAFYREIVSDKLSLWITLFSLSLLTLMSYAIGLFFQDDIQSNYQLLSNILLASSTIGLSGGLDLFNRFIRSNKNDVTAVWPRKKPFVLIVKSFKYEMLDNVIYLVFLLVFAIPLLQNFRPYITLVILLALIIFNCLRKVKQITRLYTRKNLFNWLSTGVGYLIELLVINTVFAVHSVVELTNWLTFSKLLTTDIRQTVIARPDYLLICSACLMLLPILVFTYYVLADRTTAAVKNQPQLTGTFLYRFVVANKLLNGNAISKRAIDKLVETGYWQQSQRDLFLAVLAILLSYVISAVLHVSIIPSRLTAVFFISIFLIKTVTSFQAKVQDDFNGEITMHLLCPGMLMYVIRKYQIFLGFVGMIQIFVLLLVLHLFDFVFLIFCKEFILMSMSLLANLQLSSLLSRLFVRYRQSDAVWPTVGLLATGAAVAMVTEIVCMPMYFMSALQWHDAWIFVGQIIFLALVYALSVYLIGKCQRNFYGEYKKYAAK
ncbi:hypothetical protein DLJ48_04215 [Oenococcus sicerae]|uniref:ABC transporter permease n=1 Tax=Oenococcus sicerae TaxID=2203724 RepID=A0ABX5QM13_9LACO|nr:hypothetical protein [Oenococcus sicerae]QAS69780.1 hypothetical protein DLJ48_04215 [Oenococcus sicerae]